MDFGIFQCGQPNIEHPSTVCSVCASLSIKVNQSSQTDKVTVQSLDSLSFNLSGHSARVLIVHSDVQTPKRILYYSVCKNMRRASF